jgi:hypothetical protein
VDAGLLKLLFFALPVLGLVVWQLVSVSAKLRDKESGPD